MSPSVTTVLETLRIRGLGVIDDVEIAFAPGLCVVTGETGAGKTMVVTGLQLLFGGRADASRVRSDGTDASVEGRLTVPPDSTAAGRAVDAGGSVEDGELLLRRVVTAAGRSRAQAGGTTVPVGVLAAIGEDVFTIHGQADQLRLVHPAQQRTALDRFAGLDLTEYRTAFTAWQDASRELARRLTDAAALRREADLLEHGLREIDAVAPLEGEDVDLAALTDRLGAADELGRAARVSHAALVGDVDGSDAGSDVAGLLGAARAELSAVADSDTPAIGAFVSRLVEIQALVGELGNDLLRYGDGADADPARLAIAQDRRAALTALVRKYAAAPADGSRAGLNGVFDWARSARDRLAEVDTSDDAIAGLTARRDRAAADTAALAEGLRTRRHAAARTLAAAVTEELHGLAMADATLLIGVSPRPALAGSPVLTIGPDRSESGIGPDGADDVEFTLRSRRDGPALALQKGASGGELSRVMLAVEVVLAGSDPVPVMVFDEVDAGVGGRAAIEVGRRLARLAAGHQVIVVTHLAQVAAFADHHLVVSPGKSGTGDRGPVGLASSDVAVVTEGRRESELARMLAGRDTAAARRHAAELLHDARADHGPGATG